MNNDDEEPTSVLSPLVTAQDRKKMIMERRRKEREQQQQQQQDTNASSSGTTSETVQNVTGSLKKRRRQSDATRATRLFSSTNDDDTVTRSRQTTSTLFGAVMERASSSSGTVGTPIRDRQASVVAASSTPSSSGSRVSWNNANTTTPSSSSRSRSFLTANSPGGFALLKVLDSVASPFHHKVVDGEEQDDDEHDVGQENRLEEWQEGYLEGGGVMDWSLKSKLRIECHPASCLLNDWGDVITYWQHPAMHPLPVSFREEKEEQQSQSATVSATMHPASGIEDMVRGREAILHRLVRQDPTLWRQRRNREWQEAFRSLFFKWCEQVENLQQTWEKDGHAISTRQMAQTCFYATSPGQTVLFRIGMETKHDCQSGIEASEQRKRIVPMIVMSSTTRDMRSKLRSMGATLLYFENEDREFDESVMEQQKPQSTANESEEVQQELEALRRAQAHGETAGADVSVSTKARIASFKSPRSLPPLCLKGDDDCAAFFEIYLNTLGRFDATSWCDSNGDVPLLLSRNIGNFLHGSLQSLVISNRREEKESPQKDKASECHASMEFRGPVLPCALQDLVGAAASRMMEDSPGKRQSFTEDDVGSHYFVVQAQTDGGKERLRVDSTTSGTAGSAWMNNDSILGNFTDEEHRECEHGELVSMIVWDISRPKMIAYKTEPAIH